MTTLALPRGAYPATGGHPVTLTDHGGPLVLYFYPRDQTPGCTTEGLDFTRLHAAFRKLGAEVYGISRDSVASHETFCAKQSYSVTLLSDVDEALCAHFGVMKQKNMYGKQVRGIERSTFVFDADHRLAREWRGVKVPGHAEDVLAFVRTL